MISVLLLGVWDYITEVINSIPKALYFISAAIGSFLDVLQELLRKLAGLDTYYVSGVPVDANNADPVLNFIFGILGIGDNASSFSALSTVFWSLAIFGLIVLVVMTIVAIIKSHYQEDAAKTSPVTYIYTALKSIFTFAIVPLVVIVGFWLSSFMLRTLDTITSGDASEETVASIYGQDQLQHLVAGTDNQGNVVYGRTDYFGLGSYTKTETFSGAMFKIGAYNANRLRTGENFLSKEHSKWWESWDSFKDTILKGIDDPSKPNFDTLNIIGQWYPATITTEEGQVEWAAYQVDYAFANNLRLAQGKLTFEIYCTNLNGVGKAATTAVYALDNFAKNNVYTWSFSKYNVTLVWHYYNLWAFNLPLYLIGICTLFGLLGKIVLGLMTRIVKCAALFLIYPAILGIAPLDDWGMFKKWRGEFVKEVLMAYGAILGMNILFLVLPYLNNISWFGVGTWFGGTYVKNILDYIVNGIVMIAGVTMVQSFMGFLNGLVGGADAIAAGENVEKGVKDAAKKVATTAMMAVGVGGFLGKAGMAIGRAASAKGKIGAAKGLIADNAKDISAKETDIAGLKSTGAANKAAAENEQKRLLTSFTGSVEYQGVKREARDRLSMRADKAGFTGKAKAKYIRENMDGMMHDILYDKASNYKQQYDAQQAIIDAGGLDASQQARLQELEGKKAELTARQKQIASDNYMVYDEKTKTATEVDDVGKQIRNNLLRDFGGAFGKLGDQFVQALNLGEVKKQIGNILHAADGYKYDESGKKSGEYMHAIAPVGVRKDTEAYAGKGGYEEYKRVQWNMAKQALDQSWNYKDEYKKDSETDKLAGSSDKMSKSADKMDRFVDEIGPLLKQVLKKLK